MKIMIVGSGGVGKSTLARTLGHLLELPVYHLDAHYWRPGWVPSPHEDWDAFVKELVTKPEWIIDGNYGRTMDIRLDTADVVIFLDFSPWVTTYRIIKRRVKYHGKVRPDLNEGCPEKLDWEFIRWVWTFRKKRSSVILGKINEHSDRIQSIVLTKPHEVNDLLKTLEVRGLT